MKNCYLRAATENDADFLFSLRNDELTRKNSFSTNTVSLQEHEAWLKTVLSDKTERLLILLHGDKKIGQVRLAKTDDKDEFKISYSIALEFRAQGYGKVIILLAENFIADVSSTIKLVAFVKKQNIASQMIFEKLHFIKFDELELFRFEKIAEHYDDVVLQEKISAALKIYGGGVLFLTNNMNAIPLFDWLYEREAGNVMLYSEKINGRMISAINPKFIVSYNYSYIVREDVINFMHGNIVNLHISLLPWNRGASPNVWSFIEVTPKGVTIHEIDAGLDTGAIIAQKEIFFDENVETLATSYGKLHSTILELFQQNWDNIKTHKYERYFPRCRGSYHSKKDLENFLRGRELDYNMTIVAWKKKYL